MMATRDASQSAQPGVRQMGRREFLVLTGVAVSTPLIMADVADAGAAQLAGAVIDNLLIETSVRGHELRLHLDYQVTEPIAGARFDVQVTELDGGTATLPVAQVPLEQTAPTPEPFRQLVTIPWANPNLWEIGAPYLYLVAVQITDGNGNPLATYEPVRFGFREVWTSGRDLMLNGHPTKLRLAPFVAGLPQMFFYTGMGANAIEFQPNPGHWSTGCAAGVLQAGSQELLDAADEHGWAVLMPARSVNPIRAQLTSGDPDVIDQYREDFWTCAKIFGRHHRPAILAWIPSMNTASSEDSAVHNSDPEKMGRKLLDDDLPRWTTVAEDVIKSEDPTRLVFHHEGGATGDMDMINLYLNQLALQEREDYLSEWSRSGDMPWGAPEHGPPHTGSYFRGRLGPERDGIPYFTEYFSVYLGDDAYAQEQDAYVEAIAETASDTTVANIPYGLIFQASGHLERIGEWTAYFDYIDLFIRNTNKSYRAWGVNGGLFPWIHDIGFGIPPGHEHAGFPPYPSPTQSLRYIDFDYHEIDGGEELAQRPEWANPVYDAYRDTMQPLLVFIGGPEDRTTAKDHNYASGERVEKTIVAIWDGPGNKEVVADWELVQGDTIIASGHESFDLAPGTVVKRPIEFAVPPVTARTEASLQISVR